MRTYSVSGVLRVERRTDPDEIEILESRAAASIPFIDPVEDLIVSLFNKVRIPPEPGVYVVMLAGRIEWYRDYFGDYDCNGVVEWSSITPWDESVWDKTDPPPDEDLFGLLRNAIKDENS